MRDDDDTDAGDLRHYGNTASVNGPVSDAPGVTHRGQGHSLSVQGRGDSVAQRGEDSDSSLSRYKDVPVDFSEVQSRLNAGHYTSIVCTFCIYFGVACVYVNLIV